MAKKTFRKSAAVKAFEEKYGDKVSVVSEKVRGDKVTMAVSLHSYTVYSNVYKCKVTKTVKSVNVKSSGTTKLGFYCFTREELEAVSGLKFKKKKQ